jgi:hypothetical protein
MQKRMNVSISRAETPGMWWIEGLEGAGVTEAVQLRGRKRSPTYTYAMYSTFCGTRVYEVVCQNERPADKWISRIYAEVKENR